MTVSKCSCVSHKNKVDIIPDAERVVLGRNCLKKCSLSIGHKCMQLQLSGYCVKMFNVAPCTLNQTFRGYKEEYVPSLGGALKAREFYILCIIFYFSIVFINGFLKQNVN